MYSLMMLILQLIPILLVHFYLYYTIGKSSFTIYITTDITLLTITVYITLTFDGTHHEQSYADCSPND